MHTYDEHAHPQVVGRICPVAQDSTNKGPVIVEVAERNKLSINGELKQIDTAYDAKTSTESIFAEKCVPLVNHVFNGYNSFIFCYGGVGSGKQHTMFGSYKLSKKGRVP